MTLAEFRWQTINKIGAFNHRCLEPDDSCMFLMVREHHEKHDPISSWSKPYSLIKNLKIKPSELKQNPARRRYKESAIDLFAMDLGRLLSQSPNRLAIVPAVTSRRKDDADYDDRLVKVCSLASASLPNVDCWDIFDLVASVPSASGEGGTRNPNAIASNILIAQRFDADRYDHVLLIDDVITTGAHFKACQKIIYSAFGKKAFGVFWARTESPLEAAQFH